MSNTKTEYFYSLMELDAVVPNDLHEGMRRVISHLKKTRSQFSTTAIRDAGKELGLTSSAEGVIVTLMANRNKIKPIIAGDDDVLTVGQLREAMHEVVLGFSQGRWITTGNTGDFVDQIMEHVNHPWIVGDIVKDAVGSWYKRTSTNQWMTFGQNGYVSDASPVRPLTKMN